MLGRAVAWAAACALVPALAADGAATDQLCRSVATSPAPQAATLAGCAQAYCTAVGAQRLCSCRTAQGWRFERRQARLLLQHWPAEVSALVGACAFEVTLADLDGDGQPEWLVAQPQGVSNGLGVSYHTLCVVWPQRPTQAPLCRAVSEWRALTVPVQEAGRAACSLMDGGWEPGSEPGRGDGTYAVGRLWRLQGDAWQAASDRPAIARRLLSSFEGERQALSQRNAQRLWYQHPQARPVVCPGPLCRDPPAGDQPPR